MFNFLLTYYREIIFVFCFIIELTFIIFGVIKKAKKGTCLYTDIYSVLPSIIAKVETAFGSGHGAEKLAAVLDIVSDIIFKETGSHITSSETKLFKGAIENILSTPKKKGE